MATAIKAIPTLSGMDEFFRRDALFSNGLQFL
jgi:hypothetical protein